MAFKFLFFAAVVAVARAGLISPVAYASAEYDHNPQYSYNYGVSDPYSGDAKGQTETRNGDFVQGQYSLNEADGTRRVVDYSADPINGFNAVVRKEPLTQVVAAAPVVAAATPVVAARTYAAPVVAAAPAVASVAAPLAYSAPVAYSAPAYSAPVAYSAPAYSAPVAYSSSVVAAGPVAYSSPAVSAYSSYSTPVVHNAGYGYPKYGYAY